MDFLAFLVQKLKQNNKKIFRWIPENYSAYSPRNWGLLAITSAPETPGRDPGARILAPGRDLWIYTFVFQPRS